jgi:hypothetical protein
VKRRRVILILAALIVVVLGALLLWPGAREPEYQGKTLSEWLIKCGPAGGGYKIDPQTGHLMWDNPEAAAAVRHIGTNALPWLLRWLHYRMPTGNALFYVALSKLSPRNNHFDPYVLPDSLGERGFAVLGPQAASAVPQLARLVGEPRDKKFAWRAVNCLAFIGEAGVPELRKALNNPDVKWRAWVTNSVEAFAPEVLPKER